MDRYLMLITNNLNYMLFQLDQMHMLLIETKLRMLAIILRMSSLIY